MDPIASSLYSANQMSKWGTIIIESRFLFYKLYLGVPYKLKWLHQASVSMVSNVRYSDNISNQTLVNREHEVKVLTETATPTVA